MFGRKKGGDTPPPSSSMPTSATETLANSPVRERVGLSLRKPQPARPQPPSVLQPGVTVRPPALPAAPRPAVAAAPSPQGEGKILVIGRAIVLSGEIEACEKLIVEGRVNAELRRCRDIEVTRTGRFSGIAEVDTAEIVGRFNGELTARKILVRASARVSGKMRYGELLVEPGAKVRADVAPLEPDVLEEEPT